MAQYKKIISMVLAFALLLTSVFVGGITANASLDSLVSVKNTYDDEAMSGGLLQLISGKYQNNEDGTKVYNRTNTESDFAETGAPYISVNGAKIDQESDGNKAVHFTLAKPSIWLPVVRVYKPDSANLTHFRAEANKTYEIRFRYKVDTAPAATLQLRLIRSKYGNEIELCNWQYGGASDSSGIDPVLVPDLATISGATGGWVDVCTTFTMPETAHYLTIGLASTSSQVSADVWFDDLVVSECVKLTAYNYTPDNDRSVPVSKFTTIGDIKPDATPGYRFGGVFADEALTERIPAENLAGNYSEIYFNWIPITADEGYCGFEDYTQFALNTSYNSDISELSTKEAFVGGYSMKTTLGKKGIGAFELKNSNTFNITGGKTYTVSFVYKSDKDIELYAGVGVLGNVPATAKASAGQKVAATSDWKEVTLTVTPEKGTNDNYALAMLIYAEAGATVYVDDVLISGFEQAYVNPTLNTGFDSGWYPTLALFEGVEMPEIWGGQNDLSAPEDTDADGVYEINNGAELAYVIKNGGVIDGAANRNFIITKDIYLNNINAINWLTGEVIAEGYTPNEWFYTGTSGYTKFSGTINGNGHMVYGVYFNRSFTSYETYKPYCAALIPAVLTDGTLNISGVGVDNAFIRYNAGVSALVGSSGQSGGQKATVNIDSCYVGANVYLEGNYSVALRGWNFDGTTTITNSYSLATTSTYNDGYGYGLVCDDWGGVILYNCYNANGPLSSKVNSSKETTGCFQTVDSPNLNGDATIDANNMKGLDVFSAGKMPELNTTRAYVATEGFPRLALFEGIEVHEIWDGTRPENDAVVEFAGGSGTEADPYQIANGAQLAYAIQEGGLYSTDNTAKYFVITKDIYLNNIDAIDWATGEVILDGYEPKTWYMSIAWTWGVGKVCEKDFIGNIDGNGHTVYGLYFNSTSTDYYGGPTYATGLIPSVVGNSSIKNLKISNAYFLSNYNAGAFVGSQQNGAVLNVDNCYATDSVYVNAYHAGVFSGLVSADTRINLSNSGSQAATVDITGTSGRGLAVLQYQGYVNITNSFNANGPLAKYSNDNYSSVYQFANSYQTEENGKGGSQSVYGVTTTTAQNMQGKDVFDNATKMPDLNTNGRFTATDSYPAPSVFVKNEGGASGDDTEQEEIIVWGGPSDLSQPADTNGDGVYEITKASELAWMVKYNGKVNDVAAKFVLTNDIYLNELDKINWTTGAVASGYSRKQWFNSGTKGLNADGTETTLAFAGSIDGNGHTIYGLYYKTTSANLAGATYNTALIPRTADGSNVVISNLAVDYGYLDYEGLASAFVGMLGQSNGTASVTIKNSYVGDKFKLYAAYSAVFRGYSYGGTTNVENCYSLAQVVNKSSAEYGLFTTAWGAINIKNTYATTAISTNAENKSRLAASCVYEGVYSGYDVSGITTITDANNMKGDDVLTNSDKMSKLALASAFVPDTLDFADHDYYIYLPIGTVLTEDYEPTFFDTYFGALDATAVMDGMTMKRGAYVKFAKQPEANKILVPALLADSIHQGTFEAVKANEIHNKYYGIETEIISKQLSEQPDDALNYFFITDIHFYNDDWDATTGNILLEQMRLITEFANNNDSVDFVVVGGDIVQGFWDTKAAWKEEITTILSPLKECTKPVLVLIGNHDDNAYADWNVNYSEKIISDLDWKNYVLDPVAPADIVRPEGDPNAKNYYYDFEKNGKTTRIFCLDAINYYQEYDAETGMITALGIRTENGYTEESAEDYDKYYNGRSCAGGYYGADQLKWLADNLANSDEFDDVLFFSHMGTDAQTNGNVPVLGKELQDVIAAYNNKTAYKNDSLGIDVAYNDDGKVLSYQFGHVHNERQVYNPTMDLWQISSSTARPDDARRNTENEACFDLMSVSHSAIRKFNVGEGENKTFLLKTNTGYADLNLDGITDIRDLVVFSNSANNNSGKTTAADVNRDNAVTLPEDSAALRKRILDAK